MFNRKSKNLFSEDTYRKLVTEMSDKMVKDIIRLCLRPNCNAAPRWFREVESIILKSLNWKVDTKNLPWQLLFISVASSINEDLITDDELLTAYKIEVEEEFMFGKEYLELDIEYLDDKISTIFTMIDSLSESDATLNDVNNYLIDWYNSLKSSNLKVGYDLT